MKLHSWANDRRLFPVLFGVLLLVHFFLMLQKIDLVPTKKIASAKTTQEKIIQVKLRTENLTHIKKQIVRSEDSADRKKSKTSYLSDKTRSFDRESVSSNTDKFNSSAKGTPLAQPPAQSKEIKLSDLAAADVSDHPFREAAKEYTRKKNGMSQGDPSSRGLSSTNDYITDVPSGDFTHLNTVEYKYYGFYHRIRQKLEQFWGRSIQEKAEILVKQGRRVPSSEELITALAVTLDKDGEIIAIKVRGTSGVKELDDAAIESFNEAGPFPNPPKDLIVNGKVTVEWGFVVKS